MAMPFVSLRFWQPKTKFTYDFGHQGLGQVIEAIWGPSDSGSAQPPPPTEVDSYRTVVEAVTQAAIAEGEPPAVNLVAAAFNRCLAALNKVIDAYSVAFDDSELRHLSAAHLGMLAFAASKPAFEEKPDVGPVTYLLPLAPPNHPSKDIMGPEGWEKLTGFIEAGVHQHPFILALRYHLQAVRSLYEGDHDQALILAATASEMLLNALLRSIVVEREGADAARAIFEPADRRTGLKARLRTEYHGRLGGAWNPDQDGPVAAWWTAVQTVRGRVVHGGYQPTPQEAYDALMAAEALDRHIDDRLADRRFDYPKTALSKLGAAGLEQRGLWSDRMRTMAAEVDLPFHWRAVSQAAPSDGGDVTET